ncbi:MAG: hypothetical protein J6D44_09725 [Pseudomonas sp.]|nr:hypothetical protein [Pseudomonas sp.]
MNKPDWKDAPEWAEYLAKDKNGEWFWHEGRPNRDAVIWYPIGRRRLASEDWKETLEARPSC